MTCTIETANYEDGFWIVRVYVQAGASNSTTTHQFEGDVNMTDQAIHAAILALYA
jgi:hypothetical protein